MLILTPMTISFPMPMSFGWTSVDQPCYFVKLYKASGNELKWRYFPPADLITAISHTSGAFTILDHQVLNSLQQYQRSIKHFVANSYRSGCFLF
jgi:hypothetical protein